VGGGKNPLMQKIRKIDNSWKSFNTRTIEKFTSQPQHVLAYDVATGFETDSIIKRNIKLAHIMRKGIFLRYVNSKG
jgi:hypothetical protein